MIEIAYDTKSYNKSLQSIKYHKYDQIKISFQRFYVMSTHSEGPIWYALLLQSSGKSSIIVHQLPHRRLVVPRVSIVRLLTQYIRIRQMMRNIRVQKFVTSHANRLPETRAVVSVTQVACRILRDYNRYRLILFPNHIHVVQNQECLHTWNSNSG